MLTDKEVIQLIDGICLLNEEQCKPEKTAKENLDWIYRIAHSHRKISCYASHDNWRKKSVKDLKELKEIGMC